MWDSAYFPLGGVCAYLLVLVSIAEYVGERPDASPEITRKIVHIGAGNVMLLAWWFELPAVLIIGAAILAAAIAIVSYFLPILPSLNSVGRRSLGTFFYALSIGILAACFIPHATPYAVIGILVMAWGDGLAAVWGQQFGRHPYRVFGNTKSWEGSAAMAIASTLVTGLVLTATYGWMGSVWGVAIAIGLFATGLESISQWGIDNLTVPVLSAWACAGLMALLRSGVF